MAGHLYRTPGVHEFVPARVMRAPLRGLSCPYGREDVVGGQCAPSQRHSILQPFEPMERGTRRRIEATDFWHWCDSLTTDYWHPPTTGPQGARQRLLAMIVAFVLAAVLARLGW